MSEPQRRDEDLWVAELERRSRTVNLSHDWARHELLPTVASAIDSRPQRVQTSHAPAFAGLAAAVAILVVLVVAMPRIAPGPSAATVAVATGTGALSAQPSPVAPPGNRALSTKEFASALAAGNLRGSTVIVDGQIGPNLRRGPLCAPPSETCYLGPLVATDPPVDVSANWVRVPAGEGTQIADEPTDSTWPWWILPSTSGSWPMLLNVDENGSVTYLGYAVGSGTAVAWPVEQMLDIDPNNRSVSQVFVVDAWLNETEPPGSDLSIDCVMPPSDSHIPGLSSRYCQPTDTLTSEPGGRGLDSEGRGATLHVQVGAAEQFGRGNVSSRGLFAISPRMYGGCFPGPSPCWEWDVVGRLTVEPNEPTPTAAPTEPVPTPQVAPRAIACSEDPSVTVYDATGLVESCERTGAACDPHAAPNRDRVGWHRSVPDPPADCSPSVVGDSAEGAADC